MYLTYTGGLGQLGLSENVALEMKRQYDEFQRLCPVDRNPTPEEKRALNKLGTSLGKLIKGNKCRVKTKDLI